MLKKERDALLHTLQHRFDRSMPRHRGIAWSDVLARLQAHPAALAAIGRMEATGGEPDVVGIEPATERYLVCDCAPESPTGRRSLCYDPQALAARKENPPAGSAVGMAAEMGIDLLTEQQYRDLQQLGAFDSKTSSWIQTPDEVRRLGGALFCDRRYGQVFTYHNGVQSYFAVRGFRGAVYI